MNVAPSLVYLANPDVAVKSPRDGAGPVLTNADTGATLILNRTGFLLWQALAQPQTPEQLVECLQAGFAHAPPNALRADVEAFMNALLPKGLIGRVLDSLPVATEVFSAGGVATTSADADGSAERAGTGEFSVEPGDSLLYYRGGSMLGTFQPGDHLTTATVPFEVIRPGDVVMFRVQIGEEQYRTVVHRVIAINGNWLRTQGDNNPHPDRMPVTADMLLGRVAQRARGGRVWPVPGGLRGQAHVTRLRVWRRFRRLGGRAIRSVARGLYRWLRTSGMVRRVWRPQVVPLQVAAGRGSVIKYVCRGRTVAQWWPASGRFWCRRFYDLIILPPAPREVTHDTPIA